MNPSLFAFEQGTGGEPVVLLHGFGAYHGVWRPLASQLAATGHVIAYDLPGHGRSLDWPQAGPPRIAARAIVADIERRGLKRMHLVGHSMGGAIAALVALVEPGSIASLTLLAPGGFGEEINAPLLRRYAAATAPDELQQCLAAMSAPDFTPPAAIAEELAAMRAAPGQREKLIEIAALITRDGRQGVIPRDQLATLAMPVSVLWGTADPVLPFTQVENLPANMTLRPIEAAGHMLVEEKPDAVAGFILEAVAASRNSPAI
ncbi:pyruvate dehydrogenase E2 component (dihydrolipoamide acetyltransferase) [Pseudaminobacter salicylatoxidans]|uniref:Pyruvate dehydrogenase E2 component (Dihydrolipoamide acetyltransferase) n=1 Tax=Pseudaminobacter salicylatoxidans TaxID=93369 RepID=A0A316C6J0_PSESE|nr:alpha/beta fold hydrolase [Pseudaminobacter salicylatoxidans]PWJ83617.1 pyruvate dehydrogenase E2 component (dihydrolipoamide acetyltransferase) [Pseudaminobacter salicylatoxidans]